MSDKPMIDRKVTPSEPDERGPFDPLRPGEEEQIERAMTGRDSNGDPLIEGLPIRKATGASDDYEQHEAAIDDLVERGLLRPVHVIEDTLDDALSHEQRARADALWQARGILERSVMQGRFDSAQLLEVATFILDGGNE